jgi:hypothetical protein
VAGIEAHTSHHQTNGRHRRLQQTSHHIHPFDLYFCPWPVFNGSMLRRLALGLGMESSYARSPINATMNLEYNSAAIKSEISMPTIKQAN